MCPSAAQTKSDPLGPWATNVVRTCSRVEWIPPNPVGCSEKGKKKCRHITQDSVERITRDLRVRGGGSEHVVVWGRRRLPVEVSLDPSGSYIG